MRQRQRHFKLALPSIIFIALGCLAAVASPAVGELVILLGQYLRVESIITDYLIGVAWAVALAITILFWPVPVQHKRVLLVLWAARCAVTLGFLLFLEYYYRGVGDAPMYVYRAREQLNFVWGESGTSRIIALTWLHHRLLPETFHAAKVTFSMVGLVAIYIFYRAGILFLQKEDIRLLYILGLFPSILLWSSILGKDPVVLLGISLYVYGTIGLYRRKNLAYLVILVLGVSIAMAIRFWLGVILYPALISFLFMRIRHVGFQIVLITMLVLASFSAFTNFVDQFELETSEDFIEHVDTFQRVFTERGGSSTNTSVPIDSLTDALLFLPLGIFTALFRPLPGEVPNLFGILASIENVAMLLLLFLAIKRLKLRDIWNPLIIWLILVVVFWSSIYAFASFNLGTIVRYKLQVWPILLCLLLYLAWKRPDHEALPEQEHERQDVKAWT
jgi:hypothetical protein